MGSRWGGWDVIISVELENMSIYSLILFAHMLDATQLPLLVGMDHFFPPNLESKLQGAMNERLLKYVCSYESCAPFVP